MIDNTNCGFCNKITNLPLQRESLNIVYETEHVLAFHSTKPFAEVHIIIITKQHIPTIFDMNHNDDKLQLELLSAVKIASQEVIKLKGACKVEMYLGSFQQMQHVHCHVIYDASID